MNKEKEIIIDGIDVSECEFIADTIPPDCKNNTCFCYEDKDCYFKQLKRLQQELEIKEKMLDKFMIDSGKTLEKLQQENENLKTYIQKMDKPEIKTIDSKIALKNIELQQENKELKTVIYTYKNCICDCEQNAKYKQVLEEIKIISQNWTSKLMNDGYSEILEKINEVLNGRY